MEDLYMFAHTTVDSDVCDMVIDQVHEELHHLRYCPRHSTTGMKAAFKLLDISTAFLNLLSIYEKKGFEFFAEVLVTTVEDTLELLKTSGICSWRHQVKHTLIEKLESNGSSEASKNNTAAICPHYHHRQSSERYARATQSTTNTQEATGQYPLEISWTASNSLKYLIVTRFGSQPIIVSSHSWLQATLPRVLISKELKKQVEPSKCHQSSKNFKRRRLWTDKVAFGKIERRAREASEGVLSESNDERHRSRFQKSQQEFHDKWNEYKGISDTEILSEE
ncbi:unnamed protein product [Alternaria sp. RS040]